MGVYYNQKLADSQQKGEGKMTNVERLKEKIDDSGFLKTYIAEQIGITKQGFYLKISGKNEFKQSEIKKLTKLLKLTSKDVKEIFLS